MTNEKLRELIAKARILGLPYDTTLPVHIRKIFKNADDEARHLSLIEIKDACSFSSMEPASIQKLQTNAKQIVAAAKSRLLIEKPSLIRPGGSLYPEHRAEACWRDCWHFLRIAIYATAVDRETFTHRPGVNGMSELYRELNVPISSMALALSFLREQAVDLFSCPSLSQGRPPIDRSIHHLEVMLKSAPFQSPDRPD